MRNLLPFAIGGLLVAGGFGVRQEAITLLGLLTSTLLLLVAFLTRRRIVLPPTYRLYLIFLLLFALSLLWSVNRQLSLQYFLLFLSGGIFWLASFNLQAEIGRNFNLVIIFSSLAFSVLYFVQAKWGILQRNYLSLFVPSSFNHNHIGDIWAVAAVAALPLLAKGRKAVGWVLVLAASYFLFISRSRSALVALAAGVAYFFWQGERLAGYKRMAAIALLVLGIGFVFFGITKSTLFSRPYYIESVLGVVKYPLGVGVGNFEKISAEFPYEIKYAKTFSTVVHSLPLEVVSGMGLLGLSFILWLIKVFREMVRVRAKVYYQAVFFAIFANFLFDVTYLIPAMVWIWFLSLGLSLNARKHN